MQKGFFFWKGKRGPLRFAFPRKKVATWKDGEEMSKNTILIVEDESIVAIDLQHRLETLGYQVTGIASSSREAFQKACSTSPDLVLVDIRLKENGDGIETAFKIRRELQIPVIYLTAHADRKTLERAKVTEPFGYILKPFEERSLVSTIEMALYKHKMELKLMHSEKWLSTILNSIGDGVIATDEKGCLTFMNPVAEVLTGWTEAESLNKPLEEIFHIINELSRKKVESPVQEVLKRGNIVGLANHTILVARDGTERMIADSGSPILDEQKNIIGVVLVFRDVTANRKLEIELQRSQKLESLGILAGGLAHDLNNLLTAIMGNLYAAKKEAPVDSKMYRLTQAAEECALRVKEITRQFITFSKGGVMMNQEASLLDFLPKMLEFVLSESKIRSELRIPENLWMVKIDVLQIQQILHNIVLNAYQSMLAREGEEGEIVISAENLPLEKQDRPLPLQNHPYVRIAITDRGEGIPPENLPLIFDPYFTTKKDGSGLGLATSFAIIAKHKGLLTVESEVKKGSSFYVYLPAVDHFSPKE